MLTIDASEATASAGHSVQFYDDDGFLAGVVADFLVAGLRKGRPCLVIATRDHRRAIERAVARTGAPNSAGVIYLDARETLGKFLVKGRPDSKRFADCVGQLVADVAGQVPGVSIHAFGEMVDVLCQQRMTGAAIELEQMWNELIARHHLNLLCAYRTAALENGDGGATFDQVCHCHQDVRPTQRFAAEPDDASRWRHVARLEHRVRSFEPVSVDRRDLPTIEDAESAARLRFATAASHELRNPVHVLRLQLQAALRALEVNDVTDRQGLRARIESADAQAAKLTYILDDVLRPRNSDN